MTDAQNCITKFHVNMHCEDFIALIYLRNMYFVMINF